MLTFSFIMVTMLKVYLIVLKLRIRGSFLKHALQEEGGVSMRFFFQNNLGHRLLNS